MEPGERSRERVPQRPAAGVRRTERCPAQARGLRQTRRARWHRHVLVVVIFGWSMPTTSALAHTSR